jgi:hypothetical protein
MPDERSKIEKELQSDNLVFEYSENAGKRKPSLRNVVILMSILFACGAFLLDAVIVPAVTHRDSRLPYGPTGFHELKKTPNCSETVQLRSLAEIQPQKPVLWYLPRRETARKKRRLHKTCNQKLHRKPRRQSPF